jgi:hypothetical protein
MSELTRAIARLRSQLDEIEQLVREIGGGNKPQGRVIADLRDRTNDLEIEVKGMERISGKEPANEQ